MSVDLRSRSSFARVSVLLMDDCILKLEHARTQDRMRKIMYESIESFTISQRPAWLQISLVSICLLTPGLAMAIFGSSFVLGMGIFLTVLALAILSIYLINRSTKILIYKGGKSYEIKGLFRPKKVRKFRDRLIEGIHRVQGTTATTAVPSEQPVEVPLASPAPIMPPTFTVPPKRVTAEE